MGDRVPPRPQSDAEWKVHWAFYRLTVHERDAERRINERLRADIARLSKALTVAMALVDATGNDINPLDNAGSMPS